MEKEQKKFVYLNLETHRGIKSLAAQKGMSIQSYIDLVLKEKINETK